MKPRYFFLILGILLSFPSLAGRITPEQAMTIAKQFRADHSTRHKAPGSSSAPEITLSTTLHDAEGQESLYIFNYSDGEGYTIVSASEEHPSVLGFSYSGNFDYDSAPCNVRWWIDNYVASIDHDPGDVSGSHGGDYEDYAPVEPLLQTQWNQNSPYNNDCPLDGSSHSVTGCMATAMAQILNYHQYPAAAQGTAYGTDMSQFTFQWDQMLDDYATQSYTAEQASAVAELMYACGLSVNMNYTSSESGASVMPVVAALLNNFGYSTTTCMRYRNYYSYADWEKTIYDDLVAGRPVLYTGQASQGGHAFVCDGYSANGYFHFNWGWAGMYDGYFLLDALDPGTGGIGSYAGGYNSSQIIITGIQPPYEDQPSIPQTALFVDGNFIYRGTNSNYSCYEFSVSESPTGQPYFYNPLGYTEAISPGLKVVSATDPTSVTYKQSLYAVSDLNSGSAFTVLYSYLPSLPDGEYFIYPAYIDSEGEWHNAMVYNTYQDFISLSITNGEPTFANKELHSALVPELVLNALQLAGPLYSQAYNPLTLTITNTGEEDFSGVITARLTDSETGSNAYSCSVTISVPAESTRNTSMTKPVSAPAGSYNFGIYYQGNLLGQTIPVEVVEAPALPTSSLKVTECSPAFTTSGEDYPLELSIFNTTKDPVSSTLTFTLYDARTGAMQSSRTLASTITFSGSSIRKLSVMPFKLKAKAGEYYWIVTDSEGKDLSGHFPLRVVEGPYTADGVTYYIDDATAKTAYVSLPSDESGYEGNVVIPATVDDVTITGIYPGTFTYSGDITSVTIPETIKSISPAEFYGCDALEELTVMSPEPIALGYKGLPENASEILATVPYGAANLYARTDGWSDLKWGSWEFSMPASVTVDPSYLLDAPESTLSGKGLLKDSASGAPYEPYYVSKEETPSLMVNNAGPGRCVAMISYDGIAPQIDYPAGVPFTLPALEGGTGECRFDAATAVTSLETDSTTTSDVYSLTGVRIASKASDDAIKSLPAGIYVVGNRKVVVK